MDNPRLDGLLNIAEVQKQKILAIGLGSLGSFTMMGLAYPWKEMRLVDPEKIEEGNVVRHLGGLSDVRAKTSKVMIAKNYLIDHGVFPNSVKANQQTIESYLTSCADCTLAIVTIDNLRVIEQINLWAVRNKIPVIYGGVYRGGVGGQVAIVPRPHEVCKRCADLTFKKQPGTHQVTYPYGTFPVPMMVPGLSASVMSIASEMALAVMDFVRKGGDVDSKIVIRAIDWVPLLDLPKMVEPGEQKATDMKWLGLKLKPNLKLSRPDDNGNTQLLMKGLLEASIDRMSACPNHGGVILPEEV